jgi:hypothetical protein
MTIAKESINQSMMMERGRKQSTSSPDDSIRSSSSAATNHHEIRLSCNTNTSVDPPGIWMDRKEQAFE